jgi:hypothetical protein
MDIFGLLNLLSEKMNFEVIVGSWRVDLSIKIKNGNKLLT